MLENWKDGQILFTTQPEPADSTFYQNIWKAKAMFAARAAFEWVVLFLATVLFKRLANLSKQFAGERDSGHTSC